MSPHCTAFKVELLPDGMVRLSGGLWSEVIPASSIADRLEFYRRLRDRRSGQFAEFYAEKVRVLEASERDFLERSR